MVTQKFPQHPHDQHPHTKAPPNVVYAQLKFMWADGTKEDSLQFIRQFSASLSRDLKAESHDNPSHPGVPKQKLTELSKLLARCYLKTGEWQVVLANDWGEVSNLSSLLKLSSQTVVAQRGRHLTLLLSRDTL